MSLLFGDFVSSCPSRAVDEDEDYEDGEGIKEPVSPSVVRWSQKAKQEMIGGGPIKCTSLIVAIGQAATGFVQVHVLSSQPSEIIGVVCCGMGEQDVNSLGQKEHTDHTCFIHRLTGHPGVIFVQCKVDVAIGQVFMWTEQVISRLCSVSTSVTVLSVAAITEYKSCFAPSDLPTNFIRSLCTDAVEQQLIFPPLEQPNILTGLPAQILMYCQIHHLSCTLYVCFADFSNLLSETIKPFCKLLSSPHFKDFALVNSEAEMQIKKLCDAHIKHTTLYI